MLFANEKTDSTYELFHCIATSTSPVVALALEVDDVLVHRVLRLVDVRDEVADPAFVVELVGLALRRARHAGRCAAPG